MIRNMKIWKKNLLSISLFKIFVYKLLLLCNISRSLYINLTRFIKQVAENDRSLFWWLVLKSYLFFMAKCFINVEITIQDREKIYIYKQQIYRMFIFDKKKKKRKSILAMICCCCCWRKKNSLKKLIVHKNIKWMNEGEESFGVVQQFCEINAKRATNEKTKKNSFFSIFKMKFFCFYV